MIRALTLFGLLAVLLVPLDAAALWFDEPEQCAADLAAGEPTSVGMSVGDIEASWFELSAGDCSSADPADPSSNACFEDAEHPISTLPAFIAETQAERIVADMVDDAVQQLARLDAPSLPSPTEASVEDPTLPGVPLLARSAVPKQPRTPNSCAVYPDECESAPWVPNLNFEVSVPSALDISDELHVDVLPDLDDQNGLSETGLGPAAGHERVLERPPKIA